MIKPFTILASRPEHEDHTGVMFSVSKRFRIDENHDLTETMEGYCCVPPGEDVDLFLYNYLKQGGWVE